MYRFLQNFSRYRIPFFLICILFVGCIFRLAYQYDIEFKHDEAETFWYFEKIRDENHGLPLVGQPSSSGLRHPAFGLWIFLLPTIPLSEIIPPDMARVPQAFGCLALFLWLYFAIRKVRDNQEAWLWGLAIAAVNPLQVLLERKLWHPSLFPFFIMWTIMAWWDREKKWRGAFSWGLAGALIGQIHMGAFFFSLALLVWTWFLDPARKKISWPHWIGGSALGALPLLPWIYWLLFESATTDGVNYKLHRWFTFKYWIYWIRNPFGWNSKYPLGEDVQKFYEWPLIGMSPTYFVGVVHLLLIACNFYFLFLLARWAFRNRSAWKQKLFTHSSQTRLLLNIGFVGCGLLVTAAAINITRYFHLALYPLPFVFVAYGAFRWCPRPRLFLATLVAAQAIITLFFTLYVHSVTDPIRGDYGAPYGNQGSEEWRMKFENYIPLEKRE